MPHTLRSVTIALALIGSTGLAFAAGDKTPASSASQMQSGTTGQSSSTMSKDTLSLTSAQKQTIAKELTSEKAASGASFTASVGAKVPESITLKPVPMKVASDMPSVKPYSYVKTQDEDIVLVNPKDRTIAAVIDGDASTTGSSSSSGSASGSMKK
jgi:hypothetical protein